MNAETKTESTESVNPIEAATTYEMATQRSVGLGMFNSSDIDIPKLNVIQKMSQIDGTTGSVVLDKEIEIVQPEGKIPVIVLSATKRWKEDVPYDEEIMPKIVSTEIEAIELANESNYEIIEFAEVVLLIPQTKDGDDSYFPYPIGDKNYAIARITVQKDAFRMTYKRLYTFNRFNPKTPVASIYWMFGTELMTKGKYSWWVPSLTSTKNVAEPEVLEFVEAARNA